MVDLEAIAADVVECAIKVHRALGPGLLESAYQYCHAYELKKRGWEAETKVKLPLMYEGQKIDVGYKIDTLINKLVIVENKVVETILPSTSPGVRSIPRSLLFFSSSNLRALPGTCDRGKCCACAVSKKTCPLISEA